MTFESKIWSIETISAKPIYVLTRWQAFECRVGRSKGRSRHFVGAPGPDINPVISGAIVRFDPGSSCGATASDKVYQLDHEIGLSQAGKRMWSNWLHASKATDVIDVTRQIVNLLACPLAINPPQTDDEGEVRELTAADLRTFKPASEFLLPIFKKDISSPCETTHSITETKPSLSTREQMRLVRECLEDSQRKENSMGTRLDAAIQALAYLDRNAVGDPAIQYYIDRKYDWPFEFFEYEGTHAYVLKLVKSLLSTVEQEK